MRSIVLTLLLTILTLTTSAEEITTGNLVTNGNFETGNANGWTTSGDVQVLNDCCELNNVPSNYDLEFGDSVPIPTFPLFLMYIPSLSPSLEIQFPFRLTF